LTLAHLDARRVRARFPTIADMCGRAGLDLAVDPIPVGPAAHYLMGGIATDVWGRTSVPGLYAAGETACTGVHGANRLASNSLLEGLVFGARAAEAMKQSAGDRPGAGIVFGPGWQLAAAAASPCGEGRFHERLHPDAIRALMWRSAGLFRTRDALTDATARLEAACAAERADEGARRLADWQRFNLLTVALLIARAALRREESRGGHYRADFPARDDAHWRRHVVDCPR
jgi:L-aspartate oxidase